FHGRDSELENIVKAFAIETPRIAILGAGGMGKTSLARAVLHHSQITAIYGQHRIFVACDTVATKAELVAHIGAHLGLKPGKDLTQPVFRHLSSSPPSLLVLDNLETVWDPPEHRRDIEEVLSLLTDVKHMALLITMRGAERPAKVQWSHPFLHPLKPLTQDAARQTFIDIAEDAHETDDIDKVLLLTDCMPLAINLLAHLVDSEGCSTVLSRWENEKTSLISEGYDRRNNLDLSISLSFTSPRIAAFPHSQDLLSLLAILPDGLSDVDLLQSKLPLDDLLHCKAALLRTALAYTDNQRRLKVLIPIQEYMQKFYPPADHVFQPLLSHFHNLLEVHNTHHGTISAPGIVA
ncbi:P-loop containing nucleoside triphosphate hydrolase protein, partial [Mycena vulgaris]